MQSHNDSATDDSPFIMTAISSCNPGGHVVFEAGLKYIIGTALNLQNLSHVDIGRSELVLFHQGSSLVSL